MVGQPRTCASSRKDRGRMQIQGVIGGIPGDHGRIDGEFDGAVHGRREQRSASLRWRGP